MQITEEAINEFIAIYRAEFEEDISHQDAREMALRVLRLYELLARKLLNRNPTTPTATQPTDGRPLIGFRT